MNYEILIFVIFSIVGKIVGYKKFKSLGVQFLLIQIPNKNESYIYVVIWAK